MGLPAKLPAPLPAPLKAATHKPINKDADHPSSNVVTQERHQNKAKTQKPPMYKVLILNDDYTPMEFVVVILEKFFNKPAEEATQIMLHVHQKGVGVCGVYSREIAETKVTLVTDFSRRNEHPLQCTMEKT